MSWGSKVRKAGRHRAPRQVWQLLAPAVAALAATALWAALPAGGAAARAQGAGAGRAWSRIR